MSQKAPPPESVAGPQLVGRGSSLSPPNRFERVRLTFDELSDDSTQDGEGLKRAKISTEFFDDSARSLLRRNDSPDLPFTYSLNPYRGCEHGCAYCYARPTHETLGWNAGVDFETKIIVKRNAAELLRRELAHPSWTGEPITISGVTDCYQPAERQLGITRQCLEVLVEHGQSFSIVTKNALLLRDLDLLRAAATQSLVHVYISLTTLDSQLARVLEPRTSHVAARLKAIQELAGQKIPVAAFVAPVIPGLTDHEIPNLLRACAEHGAQHASWTLLRLPGAVREVFLDWLERNLPLACERVAQRIRECRNGELNQSAFGQRMCGSGPYAEQIRQTFHVFARQTGLDQPLPPLNQTLFRRPVPEQRQRCFAFAENEP